MTDDKREAPEWPREIWMAEREEFDQGVVSAVLSEWATVARYEGDKERDKEFHRYLDADIYDSAEKYHKARLDALAAERDALREAASGLIDIVEGVRGAMEHGTWRAERSNLRMKDTDEWVAFYNAARAALKGET